MIRVPSLMLKKQIGLEAERVQMYNISSAMASQFVEAANEMTEQIVELGPNPMREMYTSS